MNKRLEPPLPLPPDVRSAEYLYRDGSRGTIYLAPPRAEGPARFTDRTGTEILAFMYDYFVFAWRANQATVDIGHGCLATPSTNLILFRGITIHGRWGAETLRHFGIDWANRRRAWAVAMGLEIRDQVSKR